jgi:hypothetical protein
MNATADDGVVSQDVQDRINKFVMPKARPGQSVLWYKHGLRMSGPNGTPELAFVLKVGGKNVRLQTADGMVYHAVPHIDDPRLQLNEFQRMNGAWEYTEEHAFFVEMSETINSRMAAMEKRLLDLRREVEALQPKKMKGNANEVL